MKGLRLLGLTVSLSFGISNLAASEQSAAELMQQWLTLESQKGKLQTDWSERQQQLQQRLTLFKLEQDALEQVIKKSSEVTSDVDERRLNLLSQQDELEAEQQAVSTQLATMVEHVQQMLTRLPPPLQQHWQQKLPLLSDKAASNSEKMERILSLFKLADEFDKRIAMHRSSVSVTDSNGESQQVLVTQIYIGLSQGWYINDEGNIYAYGRADKLGWHWFVDKAADTELGNPFPVSTLVKLRNTLEDPTTASYLSLPVKTQGM